MKCHIYESALVYLDLSLSKSGSCFCFLILTFVLDKLFATQYRYGSFVKEVALG